MAALLANQVAVITGGGQGLGWAIAQAFAAEGAHLVLVGRRLKVLETAATQLLQRAHASVVPLALDVTTQDAGARLIEVTQRRWGRWDILINCAGVFVWKGFLDLTESDWQQSLQTNLSAPFRLTQAFVRHAVARQRGGVVLNIGSIHGVMGDSNAVAQCVSKGGLLGLTRSTAEACRCYDGIRVNAIAPGAIESDSSQRASRSAQEQVTQGDVAQLALYLASDQARSVTGMTLDMFGCTRPVIAKE